MTKRIKLFIVLFLFIGISIDAQELIKPEDLIENAINTKVAEKVNPFIIMDDVNNNRSNVMQDFVEVKIENSFYKRMLDSKSDFIEMTVPTNSRNEITLQLVKVDVFDQNDHVIVYPEKKTVDVNPGLHYRGIIMGDEKSLVAMSIYENEIIGLVAGYEDANLVIGKSEESERHLIYLDSQIAEHNKWECGVEDDAISYTEEEINFSDDDYDRAAQKCVRLYIEVNYDIFRRRGNINNTSNFVTGFMNQVMTIYSRENIKTSLSPLVIWNRTSPYTGTSTRALLSQFGNYRKSFDGDLAQLVTFQGSGGLAAGFNGICNSYTRSKLSVSSISNYYSSIPTYSWTVGVVAHEFGHIFGSRHTHACVWNGNGTAIDGCAGFVEGNCYLPGSPSNGGTIMSYCHTVSVGMNLSLGFGTQPGNVIRNRVANGRCLGTCSGGGDDDGGGDETCNTPNNLNITNITQSTARINWSNVSNANNYTVGVKRSTNSSYTSGNVNSTYANVSQLQANTSYDVRVRANCSSGSSPYSTTSFKTPGGTNPDPEPTPCNAPTGLQSSNTTTSSTKLSWNSVSGAKSYTLAYKKSSESNYSSVNVSSTFYNLSNLDSGVKYDWSVRTNCSENNSNYSSSYFTTQEAAQGCDKPKYVNASALSSNSAMVTIGTVDGATNYRIQYRASSSSNWRNVSFSTYGSTMLYNLTSDTKYIVRAASICNETLSEYVITDFSTPKSCNSSFDSGDMERQNNSMSGAPLVPLNLDFKGSISSWLDVDHYKFVISSNSTITIDLTDLTRDYDMRLLNSSGSTIASSNNSWTSDEKIVKTLSPGTYYVRVHGYFFLFDRNNCYNLKISDTNSSSFAMNETGVKDNIEVYPNPVVDVLNINLDGSKFKSGTKLNVLDYSGRVVYSQYIDVNSNNQKLNISQLKSGSYVILYNQNGEKVTHKFIKK